MQGNPEIQRLHQVLSLVEGARGFPMQGNIRGTQIPNLPRARPDPSSILQRLAGQSLVNEVPVHVFEIGLGRSDVTVVSRSKVKMDVALDVRARRVLIWDLETYVVDASMDVLQNLGIIPSICCSKRLLQGNPMMLLRLIPKIFARVRHSTRMMIECLLERQMTTSC